MARKKSDEVEETIVETPEGAANDAVMEAAADDASPIEASAQAPASAEKPKRKSAAKKTDKAKKDTAPAADGKVKVHKRAEKIGIVASDKMMKTVTVRVDRLVKHPVYRKYVKKRKKFMAHDDMGAKVGDKVKIIETRPMSARKRWRVVEIIQKAEL
jgi:small subunit ribosomal protein S17